MVISGFEWVWVIIGLLVSFYNAYVAGVNSVVLARMERNRLFNLLNKSVLLYSFAASSYYVAIILAEILVRYGYLGSKSVVVLLGYNYYILGGLAILSGLGITAYTILIAWQERSFLSIIIAIFNSFMSVLNLYYYIKALTQLPSFLSFSESEDDNKGNIWLILIAAALIGIMLTNAFYRLGKEHGERRYS